MSQVTHTRQIMHIPGQGWFVTDVSGNWLNPDDVRDGIRHHIERLVFSAAMLIPLPPTTLKSVEISVTITAKEIQS